MNENIRKIQDNELNLLIEKTKQNTKVKIALNAINEIEAGNFRFEDHIVVNATNYINLDLNITNLILALDEDAIKIIVVYTDEETFVSFSITKTIDDMEIVNGYNIVNDTIKHTQTYIKTEEFNKSLEEIKNPEIREEINKENITTRGLPCLHGNWCGPLCSGPGAPVDAVDAACKKHDKCYGKYGYFNCGCDLQLIQDLARYYYMGDTWAIIITEYFKKQYARNCRK